MTDIRIRSPYIAFLVLGALLALARPAVGKDAAAKNPFPLELSVKPAAGQFRPGEAVLAEVTLTNPGSRAQTVAGLSHASVRFAFEPAKPAQNRRQARFVEPIYSPKEPAPGEQTLKPGESVKRTFVFTVLTLERGEFLLRAVYAKPGEDSPQKALKSWARPALFAVVGEKVFAHRTPDGRLAKPDALRLASARVGGKPRKAEAILALDEAGFECWWVNVWPEGADKARGFLVNPYLAEISEEVAPFSAAQATLASTTLSRDSKAMQKIRDQRSARKPAASPSR
jgi:hypothetical protein